MPATRFDMLQTPALTGMGALTLDEGRADALGAELDAALTSGTPVAPLRERVEGMTLADAYAVAGATLALRERRGARRVGAKIGLTSVAIQRQLGVDQPDFGVLLDTMAVDDGGSFSLTQARAGHAIAARAEAEIAFVLERDLPRVGNTAASVLRAIGFCLPAIEIIDSRVADWNIRLVDTVADNASALAYVLGSRPVKPEAIDFRHAGMTLRRNGEAESTGAAAACLGSPVVALTWLANTLGALGEPLRAGDVVLSGGLGPMLSMAEGDHYEARISGLGAVSFGVSV